LAQYTPHNLSIGYISAVSIILLPFQHTRNFALYQRFAGSESGLRLNGLDDGSSSHYLPEDDIFAVKMCSRDSVDEELGSICACSSLSALKGCHLPPFLCSEGRESAYGALRLPSKRETTIRDEV
jgi:hypothetical protein